MIKKLSIILAFFVLFIFPSKVVNAVDDQAPSIFSDSGGKNVGDSMNINSTIWGSSCNGTHTSQIYEIAFTAWGGDSGGVAVDLSQSQIQVYHNSTSLTGQTTHSNISNFDSTLSLKLNQPFTYDPKTDYVKAIVTNAKKARPATSGYRIFLIDVARKDNYSYPGCVSSASIKTTYAPGVSPGPFSGYIPPNPPFQQSTLKPQMSPTPKASSSPTVTPSSSSSANVSGVMVENPNPTNQPSPIPSQSGLNPVNFFDKIMNFFKNLFK